MPVNFQESQESRRRFSSCILEQKNLTFSVIPDGGGGSPHPGPPKKSQKMRFFKSCDTLTTIQIGEKTQLTKVVSALKRFDDPVQAR